MTHTTLLNPYSKDELTRLEALSRTRPLSALKLLIESVDEHKYMVIFAIILMNNKGEFTEDDFHLISMDSETAQYLPGGNLKLDIEIKGIHLYTITPDQAQALKAAELLSGCLKTALLHLVNGLEDCE